MDRSPRPETGRFARLAAVAVALLVAATTLPAAAAPFSFSNGNVDGRMASASRPDSTGKIEIETADDFVVSQATRITSLTFTGLMPAGASVGQIVLEMYRVFPLDSNTARTPAVTTFAPDLQSWIRNGNLDPEWLRIGADIVGGTTFNAAFTLNGVTLVPEPAGLALFAIGVIATLAARRRRGVAR